MLEYESPDYPGEAEDEWKAVRALFCYVCFTGSAAVTGMLLLQREWVAAGSPTDNRTTAGFMAMLAVTFVLALVEGGVFIAAAAVGSWGRLRFRRLYPIWIVAGGAVYPCLQSVLTKAVRGSVAEPTLLLASGVYLLAYPIVLGLVVIARRRA